MTLVHKRVLSCRAGLLPWGWPHLFVQRTTLEGEITGSKQANACWANPGWGLHILVFLFWGVFQFVCAIGGRWR